MEVTQTNMKYVRQMLEEAARPSIAKLADELGGIRRELAEIKNELQMRRN